jgi:ribonuclease P protein component
LKNSLNSKQINTILSQGPSFKTEHFSFKFLCFSPSGVGFSINKKLGSAVLRNKLKRQIRSILNNQVFNNESMQVVVRPSPIIKNINNISKDLKLFIEHVRSKHLKN